jgi:hypothetical protein
MAGDIELDHYLDASGAAVLDESEDVLLTIFLVGGIGTAPEVGVGNRFEREALSVDNVPMEN